jgi:hypothetical protein
LYGRQARRRALDIQNRAAPWEQRRELLALNPPDLRMVPRHCEYGRVATVAECFQVFDITIQHYPADSRIDCGFSCPRHGGCRQRLEQNRVRTGVAGLHYLENLLALGYRVVVGKN